jgi:hypothetical protein
MSMRYALSDITPPSTADARAFWAVESARLGTDWVSLLEAAAAVLDRLYERHVIQAASS